MFAIHPEIKTKINSVIDRCSQVLGVLLVTAGIVLNEWVIRFLSRGGIRFAELEKRIILIVFEIFLISLGYLCIRYKRLALQNLFLVLFSIVFTFGLVELGLKFVPADLEEEAPRWIPYEYKLLNARIHESHRQKARLNRYGFNDREFPPRKAPGMIRIAVLGDSVIWGEGVVEEVIWTRKLERFLNAQGIKAEVLSWGKPGWSTLDQYRFLKSEGIKYEFDLLLIGFVVNDPIMDESQPRVFIYEGGIVDRFFVQPLCRYFFPNAISLFVDLLNGFFDQYFGYGYKNWLMRKVYSEENLKRYQLLLDDLGDYFKARKIKALFILTPENHHPFLKESFERVASMLEKAGIPYLNLYPEIHRRFHHLPTRKLWANPGDGHPGDMVTEVYASFVCDYLLSNRYIQRSVKVMD